MMPSLSLLELSRKTCIKNVRFIHDLGSLPYEIVRPILMKIDDPEHLKTIEVASPHLCDHDGEVWLELIKRNIPGWENRRCTPQNPHNWHKVYRKLQRECQKELEEDMTLLKASLSGIHDERANHKSKQVDPSEVPPLPIMGKMKRVKPRRKGPEERRITSITFTAGSRTKTLTGKGVMDKARREARERSQITGHGSTLAIPTHKLAQFATPIVRAPRAWVQNHLKPQSTPAPIDSTIQPPEIFVPKTKMSPFEREEKLRAIQNSNDVKKSGFIASRARGQGRNQDCAPTTPVGRNGNLHTAVTPRLQQGFDISSTMESSKAISPSIGEDGKHTVPQSSPDGKAAKLLVKKRAPVDCFIPTKRRKIQ